MLKQLVSDQGMVATDEPIAPISPIWGDLPTPQRDIEGARRLLAEAGHPDGIDIPVHTTTLGPNLVELAQVYAERATRPASARRCARSRRQTSVARELALSSPSSASRSRCAPSGLLADIFYGPRPGPGRPLPHALGEPARFQPLYDAARSEPDPDARRTKYGELQRLLADDANTMIPIFVKT